MNLNKTYTMEEGPPPTTEEVHQKFVNKELLTLLDSSPTEKQVQLFLERNPALVPGAWTPGTKSGHYPLHCALITQPKLQGLTNRIPDFMWISTHSGCWYPTLIEIEDPKKKIFTKAGTPRAEFSQARNQLEQWKSWFSDPANVQSFMEKYQIPDYMRRWRQMELHMILVYGRREEFEKDSSRSKDRQSLLGAGMELMSYDRLSYDRELSEAITIRMGIRNRYEAVYIPPTFTLGPNLSHRLNEIEGIDEVIMSSGEIEPERKSFLKMRIPYWRKWQASGEKGIRTSGDYE